MRSRASAKKAGSNHESCVAAFLAMALGDSRIERRAKSGAKDRGDITGLMIRGQRLVVECKDYSGRDRIPQWLKEAELERGNDDALAGMVVSKLRGIPADRRKLTRMAAQPVTMTLLDLAALIAGDRIYVIENMKEWEREHEQQPDC